MKLTREHVLRVALQILDEVGLEALTMRRLATALKVQPGALYWHFADKQALQDAMADAIAGDLLEPAVEGTWDQRLAELARRMERGISRHRDGARLTSEVLRPGPHMLDGAEAMLQALTEGGFTGREALWASGVLGSFVVGFVLDVESLRRMRSGLGAVLRSFGKTLDPERFPRLLGLADELPAMMEERQIAARFEFGLELVLGGLRSRSSPAPRRPRGAPRRRARRTR